MVIHITSLHVTSQYVRMSNMNKKNPIAVAGGKSRWAKVSKKERSKIMSKVRKGEKGKK